MATLNQLIRGLWISKAKRVSVPALDKAPQKRGTCVKVFTTKPKKPNSAIRKVARVRLTNNRIVTAAIPGMGHALQEHSVVLVRGGRANDLAGVRYKVLRGKLDFIGSERIIRSKKRSKYGVGKRKND